MVVFVLLGVIDREFFGNPVKKSFVADDYTGLACHDGERRVHRCAGCCQIAASSRREGSRGADHPGRIIEAP